MEHEAVDRREQLALAVAVAELDRGDALLGLREVERAAGAADDVFLRYFADLPYQTIAEALAIGEGTVAATLAQAKEAPAAILDEEGGRPWTETIDQLIQAGSTLSPTCSTMASGTT